MAAQNFPHGLNSKVAEARMGELSGQAEQERWVEAAMNQAMKADRQAAAFVAASRREAEEILTLARLVAGEIAARTDRRLAALQKGRAKSLKHQLDALKRHQHRSAPFQTTTPPELQDPGDVARRLAALLT
ncbi:MAG: hypothetical protein HQL95_16260 [Magnetococcales bacterium]|nr:hypothetical protein [Magnetococcales bacterium]